MIATVASILGFSLYYIYDINSVKWRNFFMNKFFALGSAFVIASVFIVITTQPNDFVLNPLGILSAPLFLALLIYTLFFAIPFKETYIEDEQNRMAYTHGVYALCRHPGVLWLLGFTLSIFTIIPTTTTLIYVAVINTLNVLYILLQDFWTFPKTFANYQQYKTMTPFLIPNVLSIKLCLSTLQQTPGA